MMGQEEINWCWSAVTQTIAAFRHGRSSTQEEIASKHAEQSGKPYRCAPPNRSHTGGGQCSSAAACSATCNDPHVLRRILEEQGLYDQTLSSNAAPSFEQIQAEVNAQRPLPCRVQWNGGGGHFILVSGWSVDASGKRRVHVLDPAANEGGETIVERALTYDQFTSYALSGVSGSINFSYRVR
jgi:hypothetical protein